MITIATAPIRPTQQPYCTRSGPLKDHGCQTVRVLTKRRLSQRPRSTDHRPPILPIVPRPMLLPRLLVRRVLTTRQPSLSHPPGLDHQHPEYFSLSNTVTNLTAFSVCKACAKSSLVTTLLRFPLSSARSRPVTSIMSSLASPHSLRSSFSPHPVHCVDFFWAYLCALPLPTFTFLASCTSLPVTLICWGTSCQASLILPPAL